MNRNNWQAERSMTPEEYVWVIRQLGMNKAQAGRYLGRSVRTAYRYYDGTAEIPAAEALLLRALLRYQVEPMVPAWDKDRH